MTAGSGDGSAGSGGWPELLAQALDRLDRLAILHASDRFEGEGVGAGRAADLQAFGAWLWTGITGDRPGLGRKPRFPIPTAVAAVTDALLAPDPQARPALAADVASALRDLGAPDSEEALLLPESGRGVPFRPPPRWPPAAPPEVSEALFAAFEAVRSAGAPRVVHVTSEARFALVGALRWLDTTGLGAAAWWAYGARALAELPAPPTADDVVRWARAAGLDPAAARAELDAESGSATERGDEAAFVHRCRELRGEAWRGLVVVVVEGWADAPTEVVRAVRASASPETPVLVVADGPVPGSVPLPLPPAPASPPPGPPADPRADDARHLLALAGGVVPRGVVLRWAGPGAEALSADPGIVAWAGRFWLAPDRQRAWEAEARARPDVRYLVRRVAWALRSGAPARAARLAAEAGDEELAEHLAVLAPGPRPLPTGLAAEPRWPSRPALDAAAVLGRLPSKAVALPRRAARLEHLGLARAWAGDPTAAASSLAEARATEGSGAAGLRRAIGTAVCRRLAGDDAGADAAWEEASDLADGAAEELEVALRRAAVSVWLRRWEEAGATLGRLEPRAPRPAGEASLLRARVAAAAGDVAAAINAADAAVARFVEAGSLRGQLRARLLRSGWVDDPGLGALPDRAESEGFPDVAAEAWLALGFRARRSGDPGAVRAYGAAEALGLASGHLDTRAAAALGLARCHHAAGERDDAQRQARAAVAGLSSWPRHPVWAPWRLLGAVWLAEGGDHTQTWQWLWAAQEAGLSTLGDEDTADDLERLVDAAIARGWGNVLRLGGKLAADLLGRQRATARADALAHRVAGALQR